MRELNARATLLLGVPSLPGSRGRARRSSARGSWMRFGAVGDSAAVCFLLSALHAPGEMARLAAEARRHRDMLFLPVAESHMLFRQKTRYSNFSSRGRGMPTFKQYAFFQHAAAHLPDVPFVGKVDDDTAVNLPQLLPLLQHAACLPHALVGAINWAASVPAAHRSGVRGDRCGFGWSRDAALSNFGRSWGVPRTKGFIAACDDIGAVPTFPYATGAGYVFSAKLLAWVASSPEVRGWVAEARGPGREALQWQKYEDTSTGYWLTYAPFRVEYVNVGRWVHDFRCDPLGAHKAAGGGLYRPASPASLLVHNLKNGGFNAAFEQMQGAAYDHRRCMHDPLTDRV